MCDHYDSYYRMTAAEEKEHKAAQKREAERVEKFQREKRLKLATEYAKEFGMDIHKAYEEVKKIQFVIDRR